MQSKPKIEFRVNMTTPVGGWRFNYSRSNPVRTVEPVGRSAWRWLVAQAKRQNRRPEEWRYQHKVMDAIAWLGDKYVFAKLLTPKKSCL